VRIYLLAAVPFFFLISAPAERGEMNSGGFLETLVWLGLYNVDPTEYSDPLQPLAPELVEDSAARAEWTRQVQERHEENRLRRETEERRLGGGIRRIFNLLPVAVGIIMVPFLAFFLAFGSSLPGRFVAHLIFSLHLHTVWYLLAILTWITGFGLQIGVVGSALYLLAARRRLTGESLIVTAFVALLLPAMYAVAFLAVYFGLVQGLAWLAPGWIFAG
jgi:hypothetical protein